MKKSKLVIVFFLLFIYSFANAQEYGSWYEIDSLHIFRVGHGMAVLPNGNILVGGNDFVFGQDSCEIYNISNNRWTYTGPMNIERSNPKMITLNTGRVLVAGSYEDRSCEIFNSTTGIWTMTDSIPSFHDWGQTVVKLNDGRVLVIGGNHLDTTITPWKLNSLSECDIFNPNTSKWTIAAPLLIPRGSHTATLLNDGRVLVTGGSNTDSLGLRECEIYDPIANSWETVAPMNDIRYTHSALLLPNGNVFVSGGPDIAPWIKTTEVYDVQNNTWTYTGDMVDLRSGNKMYYLSVINKILILGGAIGQVSIEDTWEIFDPINLISLYSEPFPISQSLSPILSFQSNSIQLKNGNILVAGGEEYGISQSGILWVLPTKRCWEFDIVTDIITNDQLINNFKLFQNYPNPFNPSTTIKYALPNESNVRLQIFNITGELINEINLNEQEPGYHSVVWNGKNLKGENVSSGMYVYRLMFTSIKTGLTKTLSSKMMLLK